MNNKELPNILIVEDDYFSTAIYTSLFKSLGFNILGPVPTAAEAMHMIENQDFKAAILDVNLEGELVTPVAEKLESIDCPYIFSTGYSNLEMLPEKYHDFPFIVKPVTEEALKKALTDIGIETR